MSKASWRSWRIAVPLLVIVVGLTVAASASFASSKAGVVRVAIMTDCTKNLWDVFLHIVTILGGVVAFWVGLKQWRRGQDWQRAEQMDKFVQQFEKDELLQLAATIVDWTRRTVTYRKKEFTVTNTR